MSILRNLKSVESVVPVQSEVLNQTVLLSQHKLYAQVEPFRSQYLCVVMGKYSIFLSFLLHCKHPQDKSFDQRNQASSLPAPVERSVELLFAVAEFGVGVEDDGPVVEKLDAVISGKGFGAEL